ncbi:MAG: LacI family DNA-binding transcriptional regulator, partial [Lachnospiraceae bacterium]
MTVLNHQGKGVRIILAEEKKNLTINDIARELGVSKTTISRAMSGKGRIGEETRKKVNAYILAHGYQPSVIAKGLAQSRTFNICVLLPEDNYLQDMPFFQKALLGISEYLSGADYDAIITTGAEHNIENLKRIVTNKKVDGVILTRTVRNDPAVAFLMEKELPFAVIGLYEESKVIQVDARHEEAVCELTRYLLGKGLKRIALLGGSPDHVVNQKRFLGVRQAYRIMKTDEKYLTLYENLNSESDITRAVQDVLYGGCDCILCGDDRITISVLNKLRRANVAVPEEMRIATLFESIILDHYVPAITGLTYDVMQLGRIAAQQLLSMIQGNEVPALTT